MARRVFTFEDQLGFAEVSGDYNPLHVDAVAARRLMFGSAVVHGVHAVLWGLDRWLEGKGEQVRVRSLRASFRKPIRVGEKVTYSVTSESEGQVKIELLVGDVPATVLEVGWERDGGEQGNCFLAGRPRRDKCRALSADEVQHASGRVDVHLDLDGAARLFGHVAAAIPAGQIAQLLATTRLVGMECPGLHSVYSTFDLAFSVHTSTDAGLTYDTTKLDRRFGLVSMAVAAAGMTGTVTAFLRPAPQEQIRCRDVGDKVNGAEFSGQHALIVGGSRGLGEVTAKLLAAGGAHVKITYCQGEQEARRVVQDIRSAGARAESLSLDVLDHQADLAERLGKDQPTTHLYYFATPFIAVGTQGTFSPSAFRTFCDYYVVGFVRIIDQLRKRGLKGVLYPSSVFVDEPPSNMGEYAAAKAAGDVLCAFLAKARRELVVHNPRLARMATDQTASFLPADNQDPLPIMLEHLRCLRDSCVSARKE